MIIRGLISRDWEKKHKKRLSHDSRSPGLHLNSGPPEYEAGELTTR
jgi:hypothetical protein